MTCIVAILDRGRAFVGADSAVTAGESRRIQREPKIFRTAGAIIGGSGSGPWCNAMRWSVAWPQVVTLEWLATELRSFPLPDPTDDNEGTTLVATPAGLWEFDSGLDPYSPVEPWTAIGSGSDPALGALYASRRLPPRKRLQLALEAAARYTTTVHPPYRYLSL